MKFSLRATRHLEYLFRQLTEIIVKRFANGLRCFSISETWIYIMSRIEVFHNYYSYSYMSMFMTLLN